MTSSQTITAYPSDSASAKTSSPSSPAPASVVVDRLPVDVVTIGTDWEACSEASADVLSVKTVTVQKGKHGVNLNFLNKVYGNLKHEEKLLEYSWLYNLFWKVKVSNFYLWISCRLPGAAICKGVVGTLRPPDSSSWARKSGVSYIPKPATHNVAVTIKTDKKNPTD